MNKSPYTNHSNKKNPKHEEPLDQWRKIGTHYHTIPAVEIIQIKRERTKSKKGHGERMGFPVRKATVCHRNIMTFSNNSIWQKQRD